MSRQASAQAIAAALGAAALAVVAGGCPRDEAVLRGRVFADLDGDGRRSSGEPSVAGVTVVWEARAFAESDADGRFTLAPAGEPGPGGDLVWARPPDGYRPAPPFVVVGGEAARAGDLELPLEPLPAELAAAPLAFVHASDPHVGAVPEDDWRAAVAQAVEAAPGVRFVAITGDLSHGGARADLASLAAAFAGAAADLVPVQGGHDVAWEDPGSYRSVFGPALYAFDTGGVHFVVLGEGPSAEERAAFVRADLARTPGAPEVMVLAHVPLVLPGEEELLAALVEGGAARIFCGHAHASRTVLHPEGPGIAERISQPLAMGGFDLTPAGFAVVRRADGGALSIEARASVPAPIARRVHPPPGACVPPGPTELIVAVAPPPDEVLASLDGGAPVVLAARGGWTYAAPIVLPAGASGPALSITVRRGAALERLDEPVCVAAEVAVPEAPLADWAQLGGEPAHRGRAPDEIRPPLAVAWARTVGGHLVGGSPALADGRLYVAVAAPGGPDEAGGVVALDARTGQPRWERRVGGAVRGAPAVAQGRVVIGREDGLLVALDAATGADAWTRDLGAGLAPAAAALLASPTIVDGQVLAGVAHRQVALDVVTGAPAWEVSPSPRSVDASAAAVAASDGVGVMVAGRGEEGLVARDLASGGERWRLPPPLPIGLHAAPVIDAGAIFVTNAMTNVARLDAATGAPAWTVWLDEEGGQWSYWIAGTPALASGVLVVPTGHGFVEGLWTSDGTRAWRVGGEPSLIAVAPYAGRAAAFQGSPVVTGSVVWIGGADGVLRALDLRSGAEIGAVDLGVPILAGLVPSGRTLFVATWDGTVRALVGE